MSFNFFISFQIEQFLQEWKERMLTVMLYQKAVSFRFDIPLM